MIDKDFALRFADEWIAAWNSHDLDRILEHYRDDFQMSSPMIERYTNESSGNLCGKEAVAQYWSGALERAPDLMFELKQVLQGANSVSIYYQGVRGASIEVFFFDDSGKVERAMAHYDL